MIVLEILQLSLVAVLIFLIHGYQPIESISPLEDRLTYSRGDYEIAIAKKDYANIIGMIEQLTLSIPDPTYYNIRAKRVPYDSDTINIYYANGEKHTISLKNGFWYNGRRYGRVDYDGRQYLADQWMVDVYKAALESYREDYYKYLKLLDN